MGSQRAHEGYLQIDHRESPGLSDDLMIQANPGIASNAGRGNFESAVTVCNHCQTMIIWNPLRTRPRNHCSGCDRYICDNCEIIRRTAGCKPFSKVVDEIVEAAVKADSLKEI
jgi:hypothetical protein